MVLQMLHLSTVHSENAQVQRPVHYPQQSIGDCDSNLVINRETQLKN